MSTAKSTGPSLLAQTKAAMVYDHPFFASVILGVPFKEDTTIETAATNGLEIRYNPQWFNALTLPQAVFLLAHEVMHIVFQHCLDIGDKDADRWNTATDLVINDILTKGKIGQMPSGGLLNGALVLQGGGTAEGVYRILPEKPKGQDGKPQAGSGGQKPLDSLHAPTQDAAELSKIKAETKIKVAQARDAAKQAGKLSSDLERLVKDLLKSEVDWKTVLHRFFSVRAKTNYSYARPKRRSLSEDTYLPGLVGEKLGRVMVAIDCSGSVGEAELKLFSSEVLGLIEDCKPSSTEIVYFDSEVLKSEVFGPDDTVKIEPIGGGGTRFSPIFTHIDSGEVEPACVVVLTDLCCDDFGPEPSYPVLWASTHSRSSPVPFGEVTLIKAGKK